MGYNPTAPTLIKISATFSNKDDKPLLIDKKIDGVYKDINHLTLTGEFSKEEQATIKEAFRGRVSIFMGFPGQDGFTVQAETRYIITELGNRSVTDNQLDFNTLLNVRTVNLYGNAQEIQPEFNPPSWNP